MADDLFSHEILSILEFRESLLLNGDNLFELLSRFLQVCSVALCVPLETLPRNRVERHVVGETSFALSAHFIRNGFRERIYSNIAFLVNEVSPTQPSRHD